MQLLLSTLVFESESVFLFMVVALFRVVFKVRLVGSPHSFAIPTVFVGFRT